MLAIGNDNGDERSSFGAYKKCLTTTSYHVLIQKATFMINWIGGWIPASALSSIKHLRAYYCCDEWWKIIGHFRARSPHFRWCSLSYSNAWPSNSFLSQTKTCRQCRFGPGWSLKKMMIFNSIGPRSKLNTVPILYVRPINDGAPRPPTSTSVEALYTRDFSRCFAQRHIPVTCGIID